MSDGAALARLVTGQRWFGSKAREVAGARVVDSGELAPGCELALLEVAFAEGEPELYQLPRRGEVLALADPALAHALLAALRRAQPVATAAGRIEFALAGRVPDLELAPVHGVGEQSNSSVVFGEAAILKAYRRLAAGESPELEMLRVLSAHGFEQMPRLLGWYGYEGAPITATLGILQAFVPGARDGWEYALESFAEPDVFHAQLRRLGEVTARMHTALAAERDDPAFRPEPLDRAALAEAAARASADARAVLAQLAEDGPAETVRARA